jgi:hypothetical protein
VEKLLKELLNSVNGLTDKLNVMEGTINQIEKRLEHLEKMDSIEHRVSANQIDLTDIKEIVEKVADFQRGELVELSQFVKNHFNNNSCQEELNIIHKRLDFQLNKISKTEEAVLIYSRPHS